MRVENQGFGKFSSICVLLINGAMLRFSIALLTVWVKSVKSVQSALSDLKLSPERLQSQCNYRPFIT